MKLDLLFGRYILVEYISYNSHAVKWNRRIASLIFFHKEASQFVNPYDRSVKQILAVI